MLASLTGVHFKAQPYRYSPIDLRIGSPPVVCPKKNHTFAETSQRQILCNRGTSPINMSTGIARARLVSHNTAYTLNICIFLF